MKSCTAIGCLKRYEAFKKVQTTRLYFLQLYATNNKGKNPAIFKEHELQQPYNALLYFTKLKKTKLIHCNLNYYCYYLKIRQIGESQMERMEQIASGTYLDLRNLLDLEAQKFQVDLLRSDSRYSDPKRLNHYEYSIFSQCGEDGIISEIFKRIGLTNRFFVEFGAGNGLQNCTTALLLQNWYGLWIETDPRNVQTISTKFLAQIQKRQLAFQQVFVTAENIESIFLAANVPEELDLLSIDIDGNDYWVWNAIEKFHPRVVICEYNGRYGPQCPWVMDYNPKHCWNRSSYYGASLKSFELLGRKKGYRLAGCTISGVNSFFVREDLAGELFCDESSSENHFEPQRHFLIRDPIQPSDFGPFVSC